MLLQRGHKGKPMGHLGMGAAESEETTGIFPQYELFTGETGGRGVVVPLLSSSGIKSSQ